MRNRKSSLLNGAADLPTMTRMTSNKSGGDNSMLEAQVRNLDTRGFENH